MTAIAAIPIRARTRRRLDQPLLRLFVLVVAGTVAVDYGASLLTEAVAPGAVIYNSATPQPLHLLAAVVLFAACGLLLRNRVAAFGCALCVGGSIANTFARVACGPVADFLPDPTHGSAWRCNPADLAGWGGSLIIGAGLLLFVYRRHQADKAKTGGHAASKSTPTAASVDWGW